MYTMRQTCCGSHVFHHCFNPEESNSKCCILRKAESKDVLLVIPHWEISQLFIICFVGQFTTGNLRFILPTSKPLADVLLMWTARGKNKKKQSRAKIRSDLLHQSLMFIQPAKRHLISMLMRLSSEIVQRRLYAVWLERNNNGVPIRGRCKSPIPMQHSPVAPDPLSLPNLISYKIGDAGRHQRGTHTHTNTRASHIIRSAFGPSGFYCAGLENGAIKSMSEASAPVLLPRLPSARPATN